MRRTVHPSMPAWSQAAPSLFVTVYVGLLMLVVEPLLPGHENWSRPWDHQKYAFMSSSPFELRLAPFSWRIGEPLLVWALPGSTASGFRFLTFIGCVVAGILMHRLLGHMKFDRGGALVGTMLFCSSSWLMSYAVYNFWLPDIVMMCFIIGVSTAALDHRARQFALLLLIGVFFKEQVLFAAPLWISFNTCLKKWRAAVSEAGRCALLVAPALAVVAATRLLMPADQSAIGQPVDLNAFDTLAPHIPTLFATFGAERVSNYPSLISDWMMAAFGGVMVLAALHARATLGVIGRWSPFLVLALAQPLVASNTLRLIVMCAPAVAVAGTFGWMRLCAVLQLRATAGVCLGPGLLAFGAAFRNSFNADWRIDCVLLSAGLIVAWMLSIVRPRLGPYGTAVPADEREPTQSL
jgi:hypothetical protein